MSTIYFHKSGTSNGIASKKGVAFRFELLANDRGVMALEEGESPQIDESISDLREYAKRRIGGVTEITAEEYDTLKKTLPKGPNPAVKPSATLHTQDTVNPLASAQRAVAREKLLVAQSAPAVADQVVSNLLPAHQPQPLSSGRKVRTNKPPKVSEPDPTPTSPAGESGNETVATTGAS